MTRMFFPVEIKQATTNKGLLKNNCSPSVCLITYEIQLVRPWNIDISPLDGGISAPSLASMSAAARASCRVIPAPITVTTSLSDWRTTWSNTDTHALVFLVLKQQQQKQKHILWGHRSVFNNYLGHAHFQFLIRGVDDCGFWSASADETDALRAATEKRRWCYFSCVTMETVWWISTKLLWPLCLPRAPLPFPWTRRHSGKTQCMLGWRGTWPNPPGPSGKDRLHLKTEGAEGGVRLGSASTENQQNKKTSKQTNLPMDMPQWDPTRLTLVWEMAPIRIWS